MNDAERAALDTRVADGRMNKRVAEALGIPKDQITSDASGVMLEIEKGVWQHFPPVRDYCNDRNALPELFGYITTDGMHYEFSYELRAVCWEKNNDAMRYNLTFGIVSAPPAVIVEAFLRTVGKWESAESEEK